MEDVWELSPSLRDDERELHAALSPKKSLFRRRRTVGIDQYVDRLARSGEPAAILPLTSALASSDADVRQRASDGIVTLVRELPTSLLDSLRLRLNCYRRFVFGWHVTEPQHVQRLSFQAIGAFAVYSLHFNGYVREQALQRLTAATDGDGPNADGFEWRFLLLRMNDWVKPIAEYAERAVLNRLREDYIPVIAEDPELLAQLSQVTRRSLDGVVQRAVELLCDDADPTYIDRCLQCDDVAARRTLFEFALRSPGGYADRLLDHSLQSPDWLQRLIAARFATQCLEPQDACEIYRRLAKDKVPAVRREAYLQWARLATQGRQIWRSCLLDNSRSLRELARFYLSDEAEAVTEYYRTAYRDNPGSFGALAGLAETGDHSDWTSLRLAAECGNAKARAVAIRGMGRIGNDAERRDLLRYLRDPSSRVVREVVKQIEPLAGEVTQQLIGAFPSWSIAGQKGCSDLLGTLGLWTGLPHLLAIAAIPGDVGRHAQLRIQRWFTPPACYRIFPPTKHRQEALQRAVDQWFPHLPAEFRRQMEQWLEPFGR